MILLVPWSYSFLLWERWLLLSFRLYQHDRLPKMMLSSRLALYVDGQEDRRALIDKPWPFASCTFGFSFPNKLPTWLRTCQIQPCSWFEICMLSSIVDEFLKRNIIFENFYGASWNALHTILREKVIKIESNWMDYFFQSGVRGTLLVSSRSQDKWEPANSTMNRANNE